MKVTLTRVKAHSLMSKIFCLVMMAMAIMSFASCEDKDEITAISGYVYLSDGTTIGRVVVKLDKHNSGSDMLTLLHVNATTDMQGYYEMKYDNIDNGSYYLISVQSGESTNGKRWKTYNNSIKLVSGENNTVNIYLQLY